VPKVPPGCKLVLRPEDDHNHAPDPVSNYNESMYFSVFDEAQRMGGWCRIGNRVNEGHAEMSNCIYLPDGRVAFMATRPQISTNERMDAGGLRFEIEEPFKRIRVTYDGKVCLLENPREMAEPSRAFRSNPSVPCRLDVVHTDAAPAVGGEIVREDGEPLPLDPHKGFARAHYDQFMAGEGSIEVDGQRWDVRGHGMRDKSWGPRYWQNIDWYRWVHVHFDADLSLCVTLSDDGEAELRTNGFVIEQGRVIEATRVEVTSSWDSELYQTGLRVAVETAERAYELEGEVLSLIPLRNRRQLEDGSWLITRITEGMTEYRCGERRAIGMSEYLDQIIDGRPLGASRGA
jgi:hypothetical protein